MTPTPEELKPHNMCRNLMFSLTSLSALCSVMQQGLASGKPAFGLTALPRPPRGGPGVGMADVLIHSSHSLKMPCKSPAIETQLMGVSVPNL